MSEFKPFPYQQRDLEKILEKIPNTRKLLFQAMTGYGKTYTFCFISKHFVSIGEKILIMCHRQELIDQTIKSLVSIGISCQSITAKSSKVNPSVDAYVCMVETLHSRLRSGKINFPKIGIVIIDECHIGNFNKCFEYFSESKILGFTATPILLKRVKYYKCPRCKEESENANICCGSEMDEWSKPFSMSMIYDDIVVGAPINELIDFGQLVPEISFRKQYADLSNLKVDSKGEFTTDSQDKAFNNEDAVFNVVLNYEELCKGKKTMVFNSSTKTNKVVYEAFKEKGYNVKMYDSVNDSGMSRTDIVEWFDKHDDAILCNCGVYTTGFDNKEVQAIILNRATMSESLFLQIVGRGGRSSKKIFKQDFILIDGGDNLIRFKEWSDPSRDWEDIFWNGIGKPKAKKQDAIDVNSCPECGCMYPKRENPCPECGYEIPPPTKKDKEAMLSEDILEPIRKIPPPNGQKIYEYTISQGQGIHFAFKIMINCIVDMFIFYRVTRDKYISAKAKGELTKKIKKHIHPCYFVLIKKDEFKSDSNRTIQYLVSKCIEKLDVFYKV